MWWFSIISLFLFFFSNVTPNIHQSNDVYRASPKTIAFLFLPSNHDTDKKLCDGEYFLIAHFTFVAAIRFRRKFKPIQVLWNVKRVKEKSIVHFSFNKNSPFMLSAHFVNWLKQIVPVHQCMVFEKEIRNKPEITHTNAFSIFWVSELDILFYPMFISSLIGLFACVFVWCVFTCFALYTIEHWMKCLHVKVL